MKKIASLLVFFASCTGFAQSPFIDSIHQILVPGFEKAYNGAIYPYEDGYLLTFRDHYFIDDDEGVWEKMRFRSGIVKLDSFFNICGDPQVLEELNWRGYDPRFIKIKEDLYLVYTSPGPDADDLTGKAKIYIAKLSQNENGRFLLEKEIHLQFKNANFAEKNWIPFCYEDQLYLTYMLRPHRVLKADLGTGKCEEVYATRSGVRWYWGALLGGSQLQLCEEGLLGIFHSKKATKGGPNIYHIGAYILSPTPPFAVKKHSTVPFEHPDFYSTDSLVKKILNMHCIFPIGIASKGEKIVVSYGESDAALKLMVLDKKKLLESMKATKYQKTVDFLVKPSGIFCKEFTTG
jgi:predicted GH43/DUF377 family glycosyl hydrolase